MKAVALARYLPLSDPASLVDLDLPKPAAPAGRDLLVRVEAVSVNPVDTKVRRSKKEGEENPPRVLGWDAAGIVEAAGPEATRFKPGDAVFYAGAIGRPGSNAQFQLVDERIVGRKPERLSFAEAAAMPLTTVTAWEALRERLWIDAQGGRDRGRSLLVIGGAGGVGSIAIQLGRLWGLAVIATASRPETREWCLGFGARHVVDHRKPLPAQLAALGFPQVDFIANFSDTDAYWQTMAEVIAPQGTIVGIVENAAPIELGLLKAKSAGFVWEFMFTRAAGTADMEEQGRILDAASALLDAGTLRTTLAETLSPINAANLREAHARSESGRTIGKTVLAGW